MRYRYEPGRTRIEEAVIALILCGTAGGITGLAIGGAWQFVVFGLTAIAAAVFGRRAFRLALIASEETVEVRNYWRRYRFRWLDVRRVGIGFEAMGVLPVPAFVFDLRDGRLARAQATPRRDAEQVAEMERLAAVAPSSVEFPSGRDRSPDGPAPPERRAQG